MVIGADEMRIFFRVQGLQIDKDKAVNHRSLRFRGDVPFLQRHDLFSILIRDVGDVLQRNEQRLGIVLPINQQCILREQREAAHECDKYQQQLFHLFTIL